MLDEKNEITKTRIGGLGSSDAKMVAKIGRNGILGDSDRKRIAIMLGLDEQKQFTSIATEHGNFIENSIFKLLTSKYNNALSNPYTKHDMLSDKYGFDIFNHIDYEVQTNDKLIWFECKATNKNIDDTINDYIHQLQWHTVIGENKASKLCLKFELYIVHYFDVEKEFIFNSDNFEIKLIDIHFEKEIISKGLEIISDEIKKGFEYEKRSELFLSDLPEKWQNEAYEIQQILIRKKYEEQKVEEFKIKLSEIMGKNNIKSIVNDFFSITYVSETLSTKFDSKKLMAEMPEIYEKYTKQSPVKQSIRLKIK